MARVPKTSGQGISRKSYQDVYRLTHPRDQASVKSPSLGKAAPPVAGRSYGKVQYDAPPGAMAIDYDPALFDVSTLPETKAAFKEKVPKGLSLSEKDVKGKLPTSLESSGFVRKR